MTRISHGRDERRPAPKAAPRRAATEPRRPEAKREEPRGKAQNDKVPRVQEPRGQESRGHAPRGGGGDVVRIFGYHPVAAALQAPRRKLIRLYATNAAAERLAAEISASGVETKIATGDEISARLPRDAVHQGLLLEARPLEAIDISELPAKGLVLALDQVTDPHNVGAILRTAAAFGVDGLITTERHSPEFAGTLAKSASGGLEHVPLCTVVNLSRALEELGDLGYFRIGLDSEATSTLAELKFERPVALVLGAEDKGLRRLTREKCDVVARLELPGAIKSLNVSNAAAIALALVHYKLTSEPI